jgi:hypothetical protein
LRSSRVAALIATASISLGAFTGTAAATNGSHWSSTKCIKTYNSWYKRYLKRVDPKNGPTTAKQNKQISAYIRMLEKKHHCVIGG